MPYPEAMVAPMRAELTGAGVTELRTPEAVDAFFAAFTERPGTALLMVNSVCGCAAGRARPGLLLALRHEKTPDRIATVFAGQDQEATIRARGRIGQEIPPSSPSFALFRDGELVHFVPRHMIEGQDAHSMAEALAAAFDEYCG